MRQIFPVVANVLELDTLPNRRQDTVVGLGTSYPFRLLEQLSRHRKCLASDQKDNIYALLSLWTDSFDFETRRKTSLPTVDYGSSTRDIYVNFAVWIVNGMRSLELLRQCQIQHPGSSAIEDLPSWVPNWSQPLPCARLPCTRTTKEVEIPWWSLPIRTNADGTQRCHYVMNNHSARRENAEEILRPLKSTLHYIPEWFVDTLDPDGTRGYETLFKELQKRPDVLFFFPDESDRPLGAVEEDMQVTLTRRREHNEKLLQKQVLSNYVESHSLLRKQYRACADTAYKSAVSKQTLHAQGIVYDTVQVVFDTFVEEVESNWKNPTRLMVQIGKCKEAVMAENIEKSPYLTESARATAFWKTLFAGQQASDEANIDSWLPHVPNDWKWNAPSPTVVESARLEHAEIQVMSEAFVEHLSDRTDETRYSHISFDDHLTREDRLIDGRWSSLVRLDYERTFQTLGEEWLQQPYDLYHRPFALPFVVPDPFWESRSLYDKPALKASIDKRHRTVIESLNAESRDLRNNLHRFMSEKIRERPARELPSDNDASLIKYALGRKFIVSAQGYFGLAPPGTCKGDRVVVLLSVEVPFILRKTGSTFQVVGESYIHGLMDGEAIGKSQLGLVKTREIILA